MVCAASINVCQVAGVAWQPVRLLVPLELLVLEGTGVERIYIILLACFAC
jgi:hypothetical protein